MSLATPLTELRSTVLFLRPPGRSLQRRGSCGLLAQGTHIQTQHRFSLVNHGLIRPLREERRHGVFPPVKHELHRGGKTRISKIRGMRRGTSTSHPRRTSSGAPVAARWKVKRSRSPPMVPAISRAIAAQTSDELCTHGAERRGGGTPASCLRGASPSCCSYSSSSRCCGPGSARKA